MSIVANVKTLFVTPGKIVSFKLVNEREQNLTTSMKLHKVQHSPTQPVAIQQPSHIITIRQPTHTTSYLHTQNLDKIKKHPS
jgi:hypothetical protein